MFLKYVYSKDLKSKGTKQTKHLNKNDHVYLQKG